MGSAGPAATSRSDARNQTIAASCWQRVRFAAGECPDRVSIYRRRIWIKRISMEPHAACGCRGEIGAAAGEDNSHPAANVRFCRSTRPNTTEVHHRRGERRKTGGLAARDNDAFFTYSRVHGVVRQHVTHVVLVPECGSVAPARTGESDHALSDACARRNTRRVRIGMRTRRTRARDRH